MVLRYFFFCLTLAAHLSCQSDSGENTVLQSNKQVTSLSSDTNNPDPDFNLFIERFSKDSAFAVNRTTFPLRLKQYDIDNDKDTIRYIAGSEFEMMDFRKKESDTRYDQWKQNTVINKNKTKATIEIRGIDNGIAVNYYFEKRDGKWMLVGVDDSST